MVKRHEPTEKDRKEILQMAGIGLTGAELKKAELDGRNTGETILAEARSLGCDLLIMRHHSLIFFWFSVSPFLLGRVKR